MWLQHTEEKEEGMEVEEGEMGEDDAPAPWYEGILTEKMQIYFNMRFIHMHPFLTCFPVPSQLTTTCTESSGLCRTTFETRCSATTNSLG